MRDSKQAERAFTLTEILIALAILGIIATFTIPKVLQSQQSNSWKAGGKRAVQAIYDAWEQDCQAGKLGSTMTFADMTPYINYVKVYSTGLIDDAQTQTSQDCSVWLCLELHDGSVLGVSGTESFGGTSSTNAIHIHYDPVMGYSGTTDTGKAAVFFLYYDGRIADRGTINNPTQTSGSGYSANPSLVPTWWSWN